MKKQYKPNWHYHLSKDIVSKKRFSYNSPNNTRNHTFYMSAKWLRLRKIKLSIDPLCQSCKRNNRITPATQVHHIISLNEDYSYRLDYDNLESICDKCHFDETMKEIREKKNKIQQHVIEDRMNDLESFD